MQLIPQPHVLDPDRVLVNDRGDFFADHEGRAQALDTALHESCAYGRQLWQTLDDARRYLTNCLPPDPTSPDGIHAANSAHPTGPDDEQGWNEWMATFAAVTSVLSGPHGDSGYGVKEARHAAGIRRNAPIARLRANHPELQRSAGGGSAGTAGATAHDAAGDVLSDATPDAHSAATQPARPSAGSTTRTAGRAAAIAVLAVLAVRGVLPRRVFSL